jgi:hypothetical protein
MPKWSTDMHTALITTRATAAKVGLVMFGHLRVFVNYDIDDAGFVADMYHAPSSFKTQTVLMNFEKDCCKTGQYFSQSIHFAELAPFCSRSLLSLIFLTRKRRVGK